MSTVTSAPGRVAADLVVVGGGIVGLAVAAAAADRKLTVAILTAEKPGAASRAAAGLLVPHYSGESSADAAERFMTAARDFYPAYIRWIEERSALRVPFDSAGAIELAGSADDCAALQRRAPAGAQRLSPSDVADLEPALAPSAGGVLYPRDGAVDNVKLSDALVSIASRDPRVRVIAEPAARFLLAAETPAVVGALGTRVEGSHVVLAAGAWSGVIDGLPRPLPVRPIRGQICTLRTAPLRRVVLGPDVYMVGRDGNRTLIGSTMEDVGYDASTSPAALDGLRRAAAAACPALAAEPVVQGWSGLRPATPDLLPILGRDPDYPGLIYACGHSRNGILLAPITASVTCSIAVGEVPAWDVAPFSVGRFASRRGKT